MEYQRWGFINFYGGGGLTAHVVLADSGLSINCPLTVDSLIFANTSGGNSYGIGNGYSITINSAWVIGDGTCARPNQFYGSYYGISNVSVPGGAVNINYGKLYSNVAAAGGATFNANNIVFDGGGWTGWNITTTPSQNYYWVGGTGQWDDPTHWALSYGGAPQSATGCIPTQNDSVFFTDLSFTAFNDMVNPPSVVYFSPECKYLSFNGTLNSPIFNPGNLYIYGSLHLEPGITSYAAFNFNGAGSGNTIDMAGVDAQRMQFNGPGDYTVTDSLWITGTVYIAGGSFTYMHNALGAGSFSIQTNGIYPTDITMDAPLITILNDGGQFYYYDNLVNSFTVNTIDVYFANQSGYASGSFYSQASTIIPPYGIIWSDTVYSLSVYASGGHMTRAESEYNLYLTSDGNVTIDNIVCRNGNAYIYSNNGMLTCDSLLILGEGQQFYHYLYGQITVNDSFFVASNGCFKNFLDGQKNTWLYMPAGKVVAVDFLYISGIDASGVSAFYGGVNSVDNGGNTNIDFSTGTTYTTSLNSTTFCTVNNTYIIRINGNPYRRSQRWEEVGTGTVLGYADSLIVTPTSFPAQYYFYASYGTNCDQPDLITLDLGAWLSGGDAYFTNNNDSDWYNCVNWSNGQFPDSTSNAHISAFSYARIRDNEEAYCKDLYIEKGATLQILGGNLKVYGDIYVDGTIVHVNDSLELTGEVNTTFYNQPTDLNSLYVTKRNGAAVYYNVTYSTVHGSFNPLEGIVYPDPAMPLIISDDATSLVGSSISYVEGAITKEGNDAFTFPVGNSGRWQPIGISAPASTNNAFTAQYYATGYPDTTTNGTVGWVSQYEYWTLDHTQGSDGVSVRLYWNDSAYSKIYYTGSNDLTVAHYNGSYWEDVGYSQATAPGLGGYVESVVTTNFSPFTFASPNFTNPMPVTWISANALRNGNDISVTWNLASEMNTSHFVLETSIDGQHWTYVGQLKAAGFSTSPTSYSYQHVQAGAAARTYRIWAVDYNGAKMRSPLAQAPALDADGLTPVQLFPNPLLKGNLLQISGVTAGTSYTVWNAQGALLMSGQFQQEQPNLSLSHFSAGIYTIQFNDHGKLTVERIVIE